MTKLDALISKFKVAKEELNKNVNMSYSSTPNQLTGGAMSTGAGSSMYRSEKDMKKQIGASPGGAQDMHVVKFEKNGQWRLEKQSVIVKEEEQKDQNKQRSHAHGL